MTIDLKWALPFVLPFCIGFTVRLLAFALGAEISAEGAGILVFMSALMGFLVGVGAIAVLAIEEVKWEVRIGGLK